MMPKIPAETGRSVLGIDPGKSGGLALITGQGVHLWKMPDTAIDLWTLFGEIQLLALDRVWATYYKEDAFPITSAIAAVLEQVGGYTGEGQPGSAMFNFGRGYGNLEAFLIAAGISFTSKIPGIWLKEYGLKKRKDEPKGKWKNRLKAYACQLFPGVHITLSTCDALLIAEYARRTFK